jgi:hypothetical protein
LQHISLRKGAFEIFDHTGYSKMKEDVAFRLEQAEKVGLGFVLPPRIADVVRIVRKNEAKPEVENAA